MYRNLGNRRKAANGQDGLFREIDDEKLKKNRKKFMSFSKRKQQHYQQRQYMKKQSQYQQSAGNGAGAGGSHSTASISSSYSSHSLRSPTNISSPPPSSLQTTAPPPPPPPPLALDMTVQSGMIPSSPSSSLFYGGDRAPESAKNSPASIFNMISSNTQRLFSFQSPSSPTPPPSGTTNATSTSNMLLNTPNSRTMPTSLESDSDLYNRLGNDDDVVIGTGARKHQLKLDLNQDDADGLQQSDFIVSANRTTSNLESPVGTVSDLIKSKVLSKF